MPVIFDGTLSGGAGADAAPRSSWCRGRLTDRRPCRTPAIAVQVVAQLGQRRDDPWPAVEQVADHSQFGALGGDVCECLLGVVGPAGRAQAGHQQPVGLQQRARAGLRLEPSHPGLGASQAWPG